MARGVRSKITFAPTVFGHGWPLLGGNHSRPGGASHRSSFANRVASLPGSGLLVLLASRYWLLFRRENLLRVALVSVVLLLVASGIIYAIELSEGQHSFADFGEALWYGIVTMTTTGYGDYTPRTGAGRIVAVVLMLGGMGLLSVFTGTIASVMVARKIKMGQGHAMIDKMQNHVLVCGWNQNAERVLEGLFAQPEEQVILVNEMEEDAINEVILTYQGRDIGYVRGDPAVEAVLSRARVGAARAAIVLADSSNAAIPASDERTTLTTLALKSLHASIQVTAEALEMKSETHLRRAGADDVVITGEYNGFLLSSMTMVPGISQVVRSLLSRQNGGLRREPIPAEFVGRTFGELSQTMRSDEGFLALAIVAERRGITLDNLLKDDYSLVDQFIKQQFRQAGMDFLRFEDEGLRVIVNPPDSYVISEGDTAIGIPRSE